VFEKNSVTCAGATELLFTDEKGKSFVINCPKLSQVERVLFSSRIKRLGSNGKLTDNEQEIIISKVLQLTPDIKWKIQKGNQFDQKKTFVFKK
jgi:hypothetical protein